MAPIPTPTPAIGEPNAQTSINALASKEDADTSMPDATTHQEDPLASSPPSSHPKKRKRKDTPLDKQPHILHQSTFRKTTWSYFHLALITPSTTSSTSSSTTTSLSPLLASSLLTSPLRAYLGTTGTAIPIDMLKLCGREIWVRIPRQDARAFRASLSGWVGTCEGYEIPGVEAGKGGRVGVAWRVIKEGGVLGGLGVGIGGDGDGGELFG